MRRHRGGSWAIAVAAMILVASAGRAPLACEPGVELLITEFMASNTRSLADEDGDWSDWIEIMNPCLADVDLDGWYLTDDAAYLTKWRFPGVHLGRGEYLVVFASGKNRAVAGAELHASFKLSAGGEYLALVEPDGVTIAHEFAPSFPPQYADVSYGLPQGSFDLVMQGALANYRVPTSDDAPLGAGWTATGFDDSLWSSGPTGLGYTQGGNAGFEVTYYGANVGVTDLGTAEGVIADPALQNLVATETAPWINYLNTGGSAHFANDYPFPGTTIGSNRDDFVVVATGSILIPSSGEWTFGVNSDDGFGLELSREPHVFTSSFTRPRGPGDTLAVFDIPEPGAYSVRLVFFERGGGSEVELFAAQGAHASFSSAFRLVGDTTNGGLGLANTGYQIGTDVRSAMQNVNASLWSRIPFGIADPGRLDTLTLRVAYADGFVAFLNGVAVASRNAPSPAEWDSAALADRPFDQGEIFEKIDLSDSIYLLQPGTNVLAVQGMNHGVADADFLLLPELAALEETSRTSPGRYFPSATPGASNAAGYPGVSGATTFSRASGLFSTAFSLTLTTPAPGAVIRYTLDGSDPTETNGTVYSGPFPVATSARVRAKAFEPGLAPGPLATRLYVMLDSDVLGFDSNLPILVVDTFGAGLNTEWLTETLTAIVAPVGDRAAITDPPDYAGHAGIRLRGSSSLGFPKNNYFLETWDEDRQDLDVSLLGMPAESDWILHGPYTDKSLMRNFLTYTWSREIGRYAVRTHFVEMFLRRSAGNLSSSDYVGVYVLMEKIKQGPDRVNIADLSPGAVAPPDVTGGFIIKKDRLDPGDSGFRTSRGQNLCYVYPKEEEITAAQAAWLTGYLNEFETVLYGSGFADPTTGYAAYIDTGSFIDQHILVEMLKNIDGYRLSAFMFKDRSAKLSYGPPWDFDLSLGNANYLEGWLPNGWYYGLLGDYDYPWWRRIFEDPEFRMLYADRWFELRRGAFGTDLLLGEIDANAAYLGEAQVRNFQRWPILGGYVWPNWYIGSTYQEEIAWMKQWLAARVAWMDSQFPAPPVFNHAGGPIPSWFELTITSATGTVYYTLDGTDPRLPGGGIAPGALAYAAPLVLAESTRVRTRSLSGADWSAINDATFDPMPLSYVNEVLPRNVSVRADELGEFDPWIELYNPFTNTVDLDGLFLSDDPAVPNKWAFPPGAKVCGLGWLLVWADGETGEGPLHAGFTLNPAGGSVGLYDSAGHLLDSLAYPALTANVSYGRSPDGSSTLVRFSYATPGTGNGSATTPILVNEYNGVSPTNYLGGTGTDTHWGRILGNGGDWFELVVVQDHLDLRGFKVVVSDNGGSIVSTLVFTQAGILSDLRSGTIVTVSANLPSDVGYDPVAGDWWLNLRSGPSGDGLYVSATAFSVSNQNTQLTIHDASDAVVFGPAGEGINPASGIGSDEVFKLQEDPTPSVTPFSNYQDGTSSTFGSPNRWSGGVIAQNFDPLRSVVSRACTTDGECADGNPCTDDACVDQRCQNPANAASCDDGNPCTENDSCVNRQCRGQVVAGCCFSDCECDDGLACTADTCAGNACVHEPVTDGTACDDGSACTRIDACRAGSCVGADPVICNSPDSCHDIGVCDPATGICSVPEKADGTACEDGDPCTAADECRGGACVPTGALAADGTPCDDSNACTTTDSCQAGACVGTTPLVCTPSDACHSAGVCDPATGLCSNPARPDGTDCDDGNACTTTDSCQSGVCAGSSPVVCTASDACHAVGACDPATGACSNPAMPDGTACSDGDGCTRTDTCQTGVCTGANPEVCTASDPCHDAGVCDPATGLCSDPAKTDGTPCDDGEACTQTDACQAGACVGSDPQADGTPCDDGEACTQADGCQAGVCTGSSPVVCTASDSCHDAGVCDPATGICSNPAKADGTACSDGNACTQADTCEAGVCTGANPKVCTASDSCHYAGTCDPSTGACSNPAKPNGTACNDGNACTQTDACQSGVCVGTNPKTCTAPDACHYGACEPSTGLCSNPPKPNGTVCTDGNACTQTDTCQSGVCTGANPRTCVALDPCHDAGTCNPSTGVCSNPAKPNGTACDDASACTRSDACQSGACVGSDPVVCSASDACHDAGTCDPATGLCSDPQKPDGTACSDGDACTRNDACQGGVCAGANPVVCPAPIVCHDPGVCDPATGICSDPVKPDGAPCDDGDLCTTEACGGGECVRTPSGACGVAGVVRYYRESGGSGEPSAKPVPNVGIDVTGDAIAEGTTVTGGTYAIGNLAGTLTVRPLGALGTLTESDRLAVGSLDAAYISRSAVGLQTLSPNQRIASDVTGNGETSSLDAANVAQFAVELIDRFGVATATGSDWKFLRCDRYGGAQDQNCGAASFDHSPLVGTPADNFYAVLYGDVNGNWQPAAGFAAAAPDEVAAVLADRRMAETLRVAGKKLSGRPAGMSRAVLTIRSLVRTLPAGGRAEVILDLRGADGIEGLDLRLLYDTAKLRIVDVRAGELASSFQTVANDLGGDRRVSMYGVLPLEGSGQLLVVTVEAVQAIHGAIPIGVVARANEGRIPLDVRGAAGPGAARPAVRAPVVGD